MVVVGLRDGDVNWRDEMMMEAVVSGMVAGWGCSGVCFVLMEGLGWFTIEDLGDTKVLDLDCAGTAMRIRVGDESVPPEGTVISVTARPQDIHLFDPATRRRL